MYLWFNRSIGTNGLNLMSKTETELLFLKIASIDILRWLYHVSSKKNTKI